MLLNHEELFLETIKDLRSKTRSKKPYHLIRACGLCRHLLLDESALAHQVNRRYKLKITFRIKDYTNTPLSNNYKGRGGRTILPLGESKTAKEAEFFNTKVIFARKHEFTVREIILAGSHYFGGVHSGKPDLKQSQLDFFNKWGTQEPNTCVWMIYSICKVVLKSMLPLERVIKKNASTGGFSPQFSAA